MISRKKYIELRSKPDLTKKELNDLKEFYKEKVCKHPLSKIKSLQGGQVEMCSCGKEWS